MSEQGNHHCVYRAQHGVAIRVRGERVHAASRVFAPRDGGLIARMIAWLQEERMYPLLPIGCSSPGDYQAIFAPADAERIVEWLLQHGVEEDPTI